MKTNLKTRLLGVAMLLNATVFAQMTFFTTPGYKFNTSGATPVGSSLYSGGTQGTYNLANGCYDNNNNLLFYVTDAGVFNPSGTNVGILGYPGYSNVWCSPCNNGNGSYVNEYQNQLACTEFEIVHVPGSCKTYYVIYSMQLISAGNYPCYIKVDCSSGNPVVIYNGTITAPGKPAAKASWSIGSSHADGANTGLAASKIISGSGSSAIRYLYTATGNGIDYHTISNSGISAGTNMPYTVSGTGYNTPELELSPDGNWLAWSDNTFNGKTYVGMLSSGKTAFQSGQQWSVTGNYKGLEFTAGSNPLLYLAGSNGLSYVSTSTQINTSVSSGSYDLTKTFLEMGKNGEIYGVSKTVSAQHLVGINTSNNTLTGTSVSFDSRYNISNAITYASGVYTLPNQIDGQDYANINTEAYSTLNQITVNGNMMQSCNEPGIPNSYYNCLPISLNATYNVSNPTQYKIDILYVDDDCDAYYINARPYTNYVLYYGAWTSGAVPANFDLRTLTDGTGKNLGNTTGVYKVFVYVKNSCGTVTSNYGIFNVLQGVSPNINLQVYDYTSPQTYLSPSQNISSPRNVGSSSLGFRVSGSSGNITEMKVKVEEYTSGGSLVGTILEQTKTVNNITSFTYENLNNYCVPSSVWGINPGFGNCSVSNPGTYSGYSGYFSYSNAMFSSGKYYKLTVTLSNPCSNTSNWTYLYVNAINQRVSQYNTETSIEENSAGTNVTLFPNPANTEVNIKLVNSIDDNYTITVFDGTGKLIKTLANNQNLSKGEHIIQMQTTDMAQGIYTFKITSGSINKAGMIHVIK
jgi:hypothetical protein